MTEYYNDNTAISLELLILSGGTTVTGKTPVALIRNKDGGNYFDFASNTFTSTTVSATAVLTSALDGIYRFSWDISGLFSSNSGTHLTVEYHDGTGVALEDLLITDKVRVNVAGGGGDTIIHGLWTAKQKKKLLDDIKDIKEKIDSFKKQTILLLRSILGKKTLQKEDLDFITDMKRADLEMWTEVLEIFKLDKNATDKELVGKIKEWMASEETAKKELITLLDERIKDKKLDDDFEDLDDEEDDDE